MGTTLKKLTSDLQDLEIESIDGADLLLKGIQLLVEHADSPWAELIKGIFPPAPFIIGLLKIIKLKKQKLDLDTCAVMAIQQTYLETLQTNLKDEKGTLETRFDLDNVEIDKRQIEELKLSVQKLRECEVDATQVDFPNLYNEPLVKEHLERITTEWLKIRLFREKREEQEAINFARRISYQLYPQLLRIVAEHGEIYVPLAEYLETVDHRQLREHRDIEKYRAYLMKQPLKPVFGETFALKDLYVELNTTDITLSSQREYIKRMSVMGYEKVEQEKTVQLIQNEIERRELSTEDILQLIESSIVQMENKERYKLTEQTLRKLKDKDIPNEIYESLKPLKDQKLDKSKFLNIVKEHRLGTTVDTGNKEQTRIRRSVRYTLEQTKKYEDLISEHLEKVEPFKEVEKLMQIVRKQIGEGKSEQIVSIVFNLIDETDTEQLVQAIFKLLGEMNTGQLMQTVLNQLDDKERVIFVQAGPGKGKSVFCQMLAERIAAERPDWIPVFIRLRDEHFVVENFIEESIKNYIKPHFTLTDDLLNTRRLLFILDGFDELWLSAESKHSLRFFFDRLSSFQRVCAEENRWSHKIIVTGRPMRIQDIESELPSNFLRLSIENIESYQLKTWIDNWAKLFGRELADEFGAILTTRENLRTFAREPLLLYMLGAMHRDGALTRDVPNTSHRLEIYDRAVSWVCGDTKGGKYNVVHRANRVLEKSNIKPYELRQLLQETALCVWHGGREYAPIKRLETRLCDFAPEQTKKLFNSGFEGVYNLLASFYFRRHERDKGSVEFSHKSFGEYLTAERIVEALKQIGERVTSRYSGQEEYRIKDVKEIAHRFYSVFGAALLTDEIQSFVTDILIEDLDTAEIEAIIKRLYHLFIDYSNGRWISEGITRTQWDELKRYEVDVNLFEFEAQAGINLFILLCLLYQQIEDTFEICGSEKDGTFDSTRFRRLLGFGETCKNRGALVKILRILKKVNLRNADLEFVSLPMANLQETDLQGANLQGVNLQRASVDIANLQGANLQGANLQGASLWFTDLREADLQYANLQGADVTAAKMSRQDLIKYRNLFSNEQFAKLFQDEE